MMENDAVSSGCQMNVKLMVTAVMMPQHLLVSLLWGVIVQTAKRL